MFSAVGGRPGTGGDVRHWVLSLLSVHRGHEQMAKDFPTPSAHKVAKRAASESSFPSVWTPGPRGSDSEEATQTDT